MSDERPPEGEFPGNVIFFKPTTKTGRPKGSGTQKGRRVLERRIPIPIISDSGESLAALVSRAKENPSEKARVAGVMLGRFEPVEKVAHMLGYPDAGAVYRAVVSYAGAITKGEETEILRLSILAALEDQVRRSLTLAAADSFVDDKGNRYPNTDRLAWHKEARQDLEAIARISGAQAAAQVKLVTPESAELDEIVRQLEIAAGRGVVEADDVIVLDVLDEGDQSSDAG